MARLLQTMLTPCLETRNMNISVDSDHLSNLNLLFEEVKNETYNLVVLLTQDALTRPWIAGQITLAHLNKINIVPVVFPDFSPPDDAMLNDLPGVFGDAGSCLAEFGVSTEAVAVSYRALMKKVEMDPVPKVDGVLNGKNMEALARDVVGGCTNVSFGKLVGRSCMDSSDPEIVVLSDMANPEAVAGGRMILHRLMNHYGERDSALMADHPERSFVEQVRICTAAQQMVVVCTPGLFSTEQDVGNYSVAILMTVAHKNGIPPVPVITAPTFQYPNALKGFEDAMLNFPKNNPAIAELLKTSNVLPEEVLHTIKWMFTSVATHVNVHSENDAINLQVKSLHTRLSSRSSTHQTNPGGLPNRESAFQRMFKGSGNKGAGKTKVTDIEQVKPEAAEDEV